MDTSTPGQAGIQLEINSLVIDKRMAEYRDQKDIQYFWNLFAMCISQERIEKELAENNTKYYGNKVSARNTLIRKELEEKGFFTSARSEYAKITCEKILLLFRTAVFSWSQGGKDLARGEGSIEHFKHLPVTYLTDLYAQDNIHDMEELSEFIDSVIIKIGDEFHKFEAVRACANFYHNRPSIGKNVAIYRDCMAYLAELARYVREGATNETYFQNAGGHIKQYRDMLDPIKEVSEDFKMFISAADKTTSQVRHDLEDALVQYIKTLVQFTQIQTKGTKDEVKNDLNAFLRETDYTVEKLGFEPAPVYKTTLDKIMFKKSGWELSVKVKK